MKRRNYLFALALPALLAACTQDELTAVDADNGGLNLVENPIENFSLQVNVGDAADTRLSTDAKWEEDDMIGLVWFNPIIVNNNEKEVQLDRPEFYANNRLQINLNGGENEWRSDAVIMEGKHFAYFPFQTVWGENKLQVKGGREILKVYNETEQQDDVNDRLHWMMDHQTMLSPAYEFTEENEGAGLSDDRRIDLYLFSNRLNIQPKFVNAPSDLTVDSYELKTVPYNDNYNPGEFPAYNAFVTEAEILANKLPTSEKFTGCNWANLKDVAKLSDFYQVVSKTNSLTVKYNAVVDAADAPKFAFLLLPVPEMTGDTHWEHTSEIALVAHTNYGDITVKDVEGRFDANMATTGIISLSELYYNAESANVAKAADKYKGFVDIAGTTRGASDGANGDITATFDFKNIKFTLPCVKDNETLDEVLAKIGEYKEKVPTYNKEKIELCSNVTFESLKLTKLLEEKSKEFGVDISIEGQTWTDTEGTHYSKITWTGEGNEITEAIANTNNYVEGTLTANIESGKLTTTYVENGGTLNNDGNAYNVTVEKGGTMVNKGTIEAVTNHGTTTNYPAETVKATDQPTIKALTNDNMVYNYATIETLKDNAKGTIELKDNSNPSTSTTTGVLGYIFKINEVEDKDWTKLGTIKYTVTDYQSGAAAAEAITAALNNFATDITVPETIAEVEAPESASFDSPTSTKFDNKYQYAKITFEGNTTYVVDNNTTLGGTLVVKEVAVAAGKTLTVKSANTGTGATDSNYALAAITLTMGNGSTVSIEKNTSVVAGTVDVPKGVEATVETAGKDGLSFFYYSTSFGDGKLSTSGGIVTGMPDGWNDDYFVK